MTSINTTAIGNRFSFHRAAMMACAFSAFTLPGFANAEIVAIDIVAQVEFVDDYKNYLDGKIKPGDQITGSYVYDTATTDENSAETVGDYRHTQPGFGVCLQSAGLKFGSHASAPEFLLELVNNHYTNIDAYLFHSYKNNFSVAATPNPHYPEQVDNRISWQLDDYSQQALSNTLLTNQPPQLDNWQSNFGLTIESRTSEGQFIIRAHVTSAVRGTSTSIGDCAQSATTSLKYIDSTLLHAAPALPIKSKRFSLTIRESM